MASKLKVFTWSDGFHSFTVATTSRPKALKAWKSDQDLFKNGLAHEIEPGPDHQAALAAPDTVIKTDVPLDPDALRPAPPDPKRAQRRKEKAAAANIQDRIARLDAELSERLAPLEAERAALDRSIAALQATAAQERTKLLRSMPSQG